MGDSISTAEAIQYCGGIASVLWGIASVHVGGYHQYCGGCSVLQGDSISTVEAIQYCGGIASVHVGG